MNINALQKYHEAQLLGQPRREEAIKKVREGIACFEYLSAALLDAEEMIRRTTKSDFMLANFYEVVKSEALEMIAHSADSSVSDMTGLCTVRDAVEIMYNQKTDVCEMRFINAGKEWNVSLHILQVKSIM